MRQFSFFSVAILLASLLFASAAPTAFGDELAVRGDDDLGCDLEQLQARDFIDIESRALKATTTTVINYIKTLAGSKQYLFWSGVTGKKSTSSPAQALAAKNGWLTINMIIKAAGSNNKGWTLDDWNAACKTMADTANGGGTAHALLGKTVRANSVWKQTELPALLQNKHIKSIQTYELNDKGGVDAKGDLKKK